MKKKTKIIIIIVVILLLLFFFFIIPYINFKNMESKILNSGERYYEINNSQLPTGNKVKTVNLKDLYIKDFLDEELKVEISDKKCDLDNSWVKVKKENNQYNYYVYLKCGIFRSNVDSKGPTIELNGKEEITLYKDEKYKELGIKSVVDNKDGKMDIKEVVIDSSNVNTSKVGTYKVTYKIKDSFNNETIKIRIVKVTETLNHIVETQTNKTKVYKGSNYNNYLKLDGILFKIVGINSDNSVKVVSNEGLGAINYNDVETWLNDYFYNKLSSSAKKYIKEDSKWCNDTVSDITKISSCKSKTPKNPVGLLSIQDYNNSKAEDGSYNLMNSSMVYNRKSKNIIYSYQDGTIKESNIDDSIIVSPVINIIPDAIIVSGDGSATDPFILKNTNKALKAGDKISNAKTGEYLNYSGYLWRVISKEKDGTTKIMMNSVVEKDGESYNIRFDNANLDKISTNSKGNIGYILLNDLSNYIKTDLFVSKQINYKKYTNKIGYKEESTSNKLKLKLNLPSMYDLYSTTLNEEYWFKEYSNKKYCYMYYQGIPKCDAYEYSDVKGIRVVAYLNKNVTIEEGKGLENNPYTIVK